MVRKSRKKDVSLVENDTNTQTELLTAINNFLIVKRSEAISPKTLKLYTYHLFRFAKYTETKGIKFIEEIDSMIISSYIADVSTIWKASSCHIAYRNIRALTYWYEDFVDDSWKSPFHKLHSPKVPKSKKPTVDIAQFKQLLSGCVGTNAKRDKAILMLAFDSALRKSEIINLNIEDVDLLTGHIEVLHGKGNKYGIAYVSKLTLRSIRAYLRERGKYNNYEPLFISNAGRFTEAGFSNLLNRVQKRAGINIHGFHSLRRGFGTEFIRNGGDLSALQKIYRHSDISTTVIYLGLNDEDIDRAHSQSSPINRL